jgi:hemerythrin
MENLSSSLSWRARYATHIPTIDAHHQGLFKILNLLQESSCDSRMDVEIGVILEHLERHSVTHFEAEESLMRRSGFPGLDSHIQNHNRFLVHLNQLKKRFEKGEPEISTTIISTLNGWLHDHILVQDMAFSEHVRNELQP